MTSRPHSNRGAKRFVRRPHPPLRATFSPIGEVFWNMPMNIFKKTWKFLCSMRFAILLLVVLAVACSAGSLITQGQSHEWYAWRYSPRAADLIVALRLDDAFHSPWIIAIAGFLCLNLLLCNLTKLPALLCRFRAEGDPTRALSGPGDVSVSGVADPMPAFARLRMPGPASLRTADGREALFAAKHRIGLWGAWVCHLGVLLLILGFGLGQLTQRQYTVYGVPGDAKPIGDTGLVLAIDGFTVDRHADGSPAQYTTDITVVNTASAGPAGGSASVSVNHPASLQGMKFYQNSTGWAATVNVARGSAPLQSEVVCAGDSLAVADRPELVVLLNAVYPDYVLLPGVGPSTASERPDNPHCLYSLYYKGEILGVNVLAMGEALTVDDYAISFAEPVEYTLIQVKIDRFTPLALIGALVTLLGLALAFYLQPTRVWAVREREGGWTVTGQCRKGGALFRDRFESAVNGSGDGS